jgi:hypothetical protein
MQAGRGMKNLGLKVWGVGCDDSMIYIGAGSCMRKRYRMKKAKSISGLRALWDGI